MTSVVGPPVSLLSSPAMATNVVVLSVAQFPWKCEAMWKIMHSLYALHNCKTEGLLLFPLLLLIVVKISSTWSWINFLAWINFTGAIPFQMKSYDRLPTLWRLIWEPNLAAFYITSNDGFPFLSHNFDKLWIFASIFWFTTSLFHRCMVLFKLFVIDWHEYRSNNSSVTYGGCFHNLCYHRFLPLSGRKQSEQNLLDCTCFDLLS